MTLRSIALPICALVLAPSFSLQRMQAQEAPRAITVDDVFAIRDVRDPQITDDGKWVAYTVSTVSLKEDKTETRIWMAPAAGGDAIVMTAERRFFFASALEPGRKVSRISLQAQRRQDAGVAAEPHGRRGAEADRGDSGCE